MRFFISQLIAKWKAYSNKMVVWKVNPQNMHFEVQGLER
jgi:hypothetical protein